MPQLSASPPPDQRLDAFAGAARELAGRRPLRDPKLRQLAVELDARHPPGIEAAEDALRRHLSRHPADADASYLFARIALRAGRREEALERLARCVRLAPDFAAARYNLANLMVQTSRLAEALEQLQILRRREPAQVLYRQLEANLLESLGEMERSVALCEALVREHPERADSWISVGHGRRALGQRDACIEAYRRAIACRPQSGRAWWSLADLRTVPLQDADVETIQAQLQRTDLGLEDRVPLRYALGKALEDRHENGPAFEQFVQGNAALRAGIVYDADAHSAEHRLAAALFTSAFFEQRTDGGALAADPIFIVGRPRSGSTLIEQILASHPAVEGTAELPYIGALVERLAPKRGESPLEAIARLTPAQRTALGEEYLARAALHRRQGRPFFIDKKPSNYQHIAFIRMILPNARIIDARRDPAASCLSIFMTWSGKGGLRLPELGQRHRDYVAWMAHVDRVMPGRVHRVIHEALLRDPETEIRRLLAALALPFDERCLRFHETERMILTPSAEQVRRPITAEGVGRWRRYEPWLGPLIDSLGSVQAAYPEVPDDLR